MEPAPDADSSPKKTLTSNLVGTASGTMNSAFVEGSPVDVLLFGFKKSNNAFASSMGQTNSSEGSGNSQAQVVSGLRNLIKTCDITTFNISTLNPDGSRLYTLENAAYAGGMTKIPIDAQMQTKI